MARIVYSPTMIGGLVLGSIAGAMVAIGFFLMRRQAWSVAMNLAAVMVGVFVVGGVGAAIIGLASMGKGGEAVTAGMTLLVIAAGVSLIALVFPAIVSILQARRLARPYAAVLRSVMGEPLLVLALIWVHQSLLTYPQQSRITNDWWQKELARRKRIERTKAEIPPQYRDTTEMEIRMDDWNREQMAQRGFPTAPRVPLDVQKKLRAYWQAQATREVIPDRATQTHILDGQRGFGYGVSLAWLMASLAAPLALRRRGPDAAEIQPPPIISG